MVGGLPPSVEAGEIIPLCSGSGCGWKNASIPTSVTNTGIVLDAVLDVGANIVTVGQQGTILLSRDGGQDFYQVTSPPGTPDLDVLAEDRDGVVWAGGDDATLDISQDQGATWSAVTTSGIAGNISVIGFPSTSFAFAGTDHGLYFSEDGGVTWALDQALGVGWARAAAFVNASTGWVDFGLTPQMEFTTDGGAHWKIGNPPDTPPIASQIYAVGGTSAYYLGRDGSLYNTLNGTGWARDQSPIGQIGTGLAIINQSALWEVGTEANIYFHAPGAGCWIQEPVPGVPDLYGVAFTDSTHGVVVGSSAIYYTTDGGTGITVNYTSPISIVGGGGSRLLPDLIPGDPDDQGPPGPCGTRPSYAPYILGTSVGLGVGIALFVAMVMPRVRAMRLAEEEKLRQAKPEVVRRVERRVRYRSRKKRYVQP